MRECRGLCAGQEVSGRAEHHALRGAELLRFRLRFFLFFFFSFSSGFFLSPVFSRFFRLLLFFFV
eukprot:SAG31_NODE_2235_length_6123_cov_2.723274_2_plen_65_part_00